MVRLEEEGDLLILRYALPREDGDEADYLRALGEIGGRETPFALLTSFGGGDALSRAGERAQALWFKATRARMNRTCRGLAIVRPGATAKMAETFQKLWTFPVSLEPSEEAARAALARVLGAAPR